MKLTIKEIRKIGQGKRIEQESNIIFRLFQPWTPYLTKLLLKLGLSPNTVTILSIISALIGGVLLATGSTINAIIAGVLFIFYFALDFCDGEVARITNKQSMTGTYLDYMGDFFLFVAVLGGQLISIYLENQSVFVLVLAIIGVSFILIQGIGHTMVSQVVLTEQMRLSGRIKDGLNKDQYQQMMLHDTGNKSDQQIGKERDSLFTALKAKLRWLYIYAGGNFVGLLVLPLALVDLLITQFLIVDWVFGVLDLYVIYVCLLTPFLAVIGITMRIKNKEVERTYRKFTSKSAQFSSDGGFIS